LLLYGTLCGVRGRRHTRKLCKAWQLSCGNGVLQKGVCVSRRKGWIHGKKAFLKAGVDSKVYPKAIPYC